VKKFANVLKERGVTKGDHVAIYLPMVSLYSGQKAGWKLAGSWLEAGWKLAGFIPKHL
jgi:hypothetical protein